MARIIHEIGELTAGALSDLLTQAADNGAGRESVVSITKLRQGAGHRVTIELSDGDDGGKTLLKSSD